MPWFSCLGQNQVYSYTVFTFICFALVPPAYPGIPYPLSRARFSPFCFNLRVLAAGSWSLLDGRQAHHPLWKPQCQSPWLGLSWARKDFTAATHHHAGLGWMWFCQLLYIAPSFHLRRSPLTPADCQSHRLAPAFTRLADALETHSSN